ncbi:MAG: ABC transporter ATP-binding protein [Gammaproteobacteria bacterium]|nr:ABC transporter ATP-binding protein [Gammaproteobacteria bacterium]
MSFLEATGMSGGYGTGPDIIHSCDIRVEAGEIAVVVGPNGAGKSTAMKGIFGMIQLRTGKVLFNDRDITTLPPSDRVLEGMAFVPQNNNVFPSMSVEENLEMGAFVRTDNISSTITRVFELFPILKDKRKQMAGELSGGQRQQVAIGRALMTEPRLLMLDEPTAGVSPIVMQDLFKCIQDITASGVAVLMVEQNARQALAIADRGFVLVQGKNRFTDQGKVLLTNPEVQHSFLGG